MAEDDDDDRLLVERALSRMQAPVTLRSVRDGDQLLEYLYRRGEYEQLRKTAMPGLILLDLNMPRLDGREALAAIKGDPQLCSIPVVIFTTSSSEEDIARSYALHANSYIQKPASAQQMTEILTRLYTYWFDTVEPAPAHE